MVGLIEPDGSRRVLTFRETGEGARPLAATSVFEIGSITKSFTGANDAAARAAPLPTTRIHRGLP